MRRRGTRKTNLLLVRSLERVELLLHHRQPALRTAAAAATAQLGAAVHGAMPRPRKRRVAGAEPRPCGRRRIARAAAAAAAGVAGPAAEAGAGAPVAGLAAAIALKVLPICVGAVGAEAGRYRRSAAGSTGHEADRKC